MLASSYKSCRVIKPHIQDWRLRNENAGLIDDDPDSVLWGVKQAFLDPKLYMFIVLQMALITAQSFNNFFPSIVGTLKYNKTVTLLLTAPPYAFAFFCSLIISFHAAHKQERGYHIAIPLSFALLGNLLVRRPLYHAIKEAAFVGCSYLIPSRQCSFPQLVADTSVCS